MIDTIRKDIHFSIRCRDLLSFFLFRDVKTAPKVLIRISNSFVLPPYKLTKSTLKVYLLVRERHFIYNGQLHLQNEESNAYLVNLIIVFVALKQAFCFADFVLLLIFEGVIGLHNYAIALLLREQPVRRKNKSGQKEAKNYFLIKNKRL